jgi:hypothetical protein
MQLPAGDGFQTGNKVAARFSEMFANAPMPADDYTIPPDEERRLEHLENEQNEARRERYRAAAKPTRDVAQALETFDPTSDLTRYRDSRNAKAVKGVWLFGAEASVGAALLCDERGSKYVDVPNLIARMDSSGRFGEDGSTAQALELVRPSVLAMCDLDLATLREPHVTLMAHMLRERRQDGRVTVFTTTCPPRLYWERLRNTIGNTDDMRRLINEASRACVDANGSTYQIQVGR